MSKTKTESKFKLKNYISYIMVIAVLGVSVILQLTGNLQRSASTLLVQIAYSIILAVSLNLVVGFLGELSLGHAGFMCVGAYLGGYIAIQLSNVIGSKLLVLIISMLAGGVIAAIFGLIVGLPALRLKGDYLAIVTLAFGEIVRTIFKNLDVFGKAMGLRTNTIKYDTRNDTSLYIVAFVVVLIVLFMINNLIRSKHGRAITAIRDNEIAAKAMGINVTFYKLFVFVFSAFFAGVAGVIYAHYITPVQYSVFSYNYSIEILVMVVLGGMASINGSIVSAALITIINFELQSKLQQRSRVHPHKREARSALHHGAHRGQEAQARGYQRRQGRVEQRSHKDLHGRNPLCRYAAGQGICPRQAAKGRKEKWLNMFLKQRISAFPSAD